MKTIVNIGTDKKNIVGVIFEKPFQDITYQDIIKVVRDRLGTSGKYNIHGWCDVTDKN